MLHCYGGTASPPQRLSRIIAMSETLYVWYENRLVGNIQQVERGYIVFQYSPKWLQAPDAFAVSLSLPLQEGAFSPEVSTAFFDNYLPEEHIRTMVAKEYGLESHSTYALLRVLGAECAGALSIISSDEPPEEAEPRYKELTNAELVEYIKHLPQSPLCGAHEEVRLSLAGAQSKGALRITPEMKFYLPQNGSPSTHILKPSSSRFRNLPENELFCMGLAKHMGMDVPPFFLSDTLPKAFIVARYDRKTDGNRIKRIHQEDFCQALGFSSLLKYQRYGTGATLADCFALLRQCENPQQDAEKLLQWVIYTVCIGNSDAHAKNISLIYHKNKPCLAPFYDLVSTAPYPDISQKLAMKIGDKNDGDRLFTNRWKAFADTINMPYTTLRDIGRGFVTKLSNELDSHINSYIDQYVSFSELGAIRAIIQRRSAFLLEQWR